MEYTVIRSQRRTVTLEIREGRLTVRAPLTLPDSEIAALVEKRRKWIEEKLRTNRPDPPANPLSPEEIRALAQQALNKIPPRVAHYAQQIGVDYGRITIRNQRSLWGSCSSRYNLNFNCLLLLAPDYVLDAIIVHELCHLKHMNHSPAFYAEVNRQYPDYPRAEAWLKENGPTLMRRMTAGQK